MAHITGGGLPGQSSARVAAGHRGRAGAVLARAAGFCLAARTGGVASEEMLRVFNCGIGMAMVVADPDAASEMLRDQGESVARIGHIAAGSGPARGRIALPAGWPG